MLEAIKYSDQLIWTFPPPLEDDLMLFRDSKDRPILYHNYNFFSERSLHRQKAYFEFHPCDQSCKIGRDTQKDMGHDILYPLHSYILETMSLLEDAIESLNDSSLLIETREGFAVTDYSHRILDLMVFFEVEDRSILGLPAEISKQTCFGFIFIETAAEFESLSFGFSSPVGKLKSGFAGVLPFLGNKDISPLDRVFSPPWVLGNDRGDMVFDEVACIFGGVVSCICDDGIDLFIYPLEVSPGFFSEFFEELSVPFISWGDFNRERDRQFGIGDFEMDLVAKESEVFAFVAPGGMGVRFLCFDVGGVNGEAEVFSLNEAEGLSDEIREDFGEGFFSESFSEVVEGVVVWGFSVGEAAEEGESSVVSEFSCEVSFGGGVAQVDEQEGFEEGDGVIAFSTLIGVFIFSEVVDEGEVELLVEDF